MQPKVLVLALAAGAAALWPIPQQVSTGKDVLFLDRSIKVTYNGNHVPWTASSSSSSSGPSPSTGYSASHANSSSPFTSKDIVQASVSRALTAIFEQGLVPWMLHERGSDFEPAPGSGKGTVKSLAITQTGKDNSTTIKPLAGSVDESYKLALTSDGHATIQAVSSTGVVRGLETFTQLFYTHSSKRAWYTNMAPVSISDAPKFPHRGLLLDVGRHFYPVEDIKRTIAALSMSKMNVFHWHITEAQSWPVEIPSMPELAEKGRYAPGLTYSPEDVRSVQEFGALHGVQVIVEIDMPGHVGIATSHPDLVVSYDAQPYSKYCAEPPCGAFRLGDKKVEDFLDKLFEDLLPRLAPYTSYFHTGGDEYKAANSLLDPNLHTDDMTVLKPLLQKFLDHAHSNVRKHGLVPMVWEEMVGDWGATVGNDTVIQSWFGSESVQKFAAAGHKVIDSSSDIYYLDCGRGAWIDYKGSSGSPWNDWCGPTKGWQLIYNHDPLGNITADAAKNVIGGEVAMWSETIDSVGLDVIAWPRAAAAGEGWWSGRADKNGTERSIFEARPRLDEMRERMLARGVKGAVITHAWCSQMPLGHCTA